MRAFIIRPFGTKQEIDFDRVERELIAPALAEAGFTGGTTAEILEAGNIRTDMFELLLLADLVIADISVDNANVFYELGLRHALRSRRTVMIRARGMAAVPFDLRTDRYVDYDAKQPAEALASLVASLGQTKVSERVDSPVFLLLPKLQESDRTQLMAVPREFQEAVEQAVAKRDLGRLGLLGWESKGFSWESEGARLVGRALFDLRSYAAAGRFWESVRKLNELDREANLRLGTIFQRQGELTSSDQALNRVFENPQATEEDRAEAYALLGSNDKARMMAEWQSADAAQRQPRTMRLPYLHRAYEAYRRGYLVNLNHFYSGLNALGLVSVELDLIREQPEVWLERFDSQEDADAELRRLRSECQELASAVKISLQAAQARLAKGAFDPWLEMSLADHQFLTAERPVRAVAAYERALAKVNPQVMESARRQLQLYGDLGIFDDRVDLCLEKFPPLPLPPVSGSPPARVILFTGHMVDAPGRQKPRFPPEKVAVAAEAIERQLAELMNGLRGVCIGLAGGASGGDLLFHEACGRLGIESRLRLALPVGAFVARSVAPSQGDWEARFQGVLTRLWGSVDTLAVNEELPGWLIRKAGYNIWARTNVWLLEEALAVGARDVHLVALWNREPADGAGGTEHLIELAQKYGVITHILDTKQIFGL